VTRVNGVRVSTRKKQTGKEKRDKKPEEKVNSGRVQNPDAFLEFGRPYKEV